jgi:hypothetical protein
MIIVREHVYIGPHVVHNHREPLKQGINGLTGEMNLGIPNMSLLQHRPNPTSQVLGVHPIELRLTQSTKQVVDHLIVGVESVPRSWSEKVHRLDIACVHRDIPKDPTLSAEKHTHPLAPHLVVLAIEVWRTRTPFLVCHPWILDWLESIKT